VQPAAATPFGCDEGSIKNLGATLRAEVALLHKSAVSPSEAIKRFQQDTFGIGEA
jgi:hypothetical protein